MAFLFNHICQQYSMTDSDYTQRFLFENSHVRGERVHMRDSLGAVLITHPYPDSIKKLLGELSAAAVLLSSTLKFSGTFTLQARSEGPVSLLMVECTNQHHFRAIARYQEDCLTDQSTLTALLPKGQLLISTDPDKGKQYKSIVVLNQPTLADCFTAYFRQSEQLPTKIWLACDGEKSSGFLLQSLPVNQDIANHGAQKKGAEQWEHTLIMASTMKEEELLSLDNAVLLHRLFNEDDIRLFDAAPVTYCCTCSKERTSHSLISLGKQELSEIANKQEAIETQCQFCNKKYTYSPEELQALCHHFH